MWVLRHELTCPASRHMVPLTLENMNMNDKGMTVKAKLTLAFGGLALLVLLVAGLSLKSLDDAHQSYVRYVDGISARATMANHVRAAVNQRAIAARNLVLVTKSTDMEAERALVAKAHPCTLR
eukprot:Opistho-2@67251